MNGKRTLVPVRYPHPARVTLGPDGEADVEFGHGGGGRELAGTVTLAPDGTASSAIALRWEDTGESLTDGEADAAIGLAAGCAESARATAEALARLDEVLDGDGEPERPRGLRLVPSAGSVMHVPQPEPGSFRTADGHRTELRSARYPVWAVCRTCRRGIRADSFFVPFVHDGRGGQDMKKGTELPPDERAAADALKAALSEYDPEEVGDAAEADPAARTECCPPRSCS
jgi:hypothetical protein